MEKAAPKQWGSGPWDIIHGIRYACIYGLKAWQVCLIQIRPWPLKNHIYHLKGLTFRNSFWYAARQSNSYSDFTLIGTLYSTHKKTHHKQKLSFPNSVMWKYLDHVLTICLWSMWVNSAYFPYLQPYILRDAIYVIIFVIVLKSSFLETSCNGKE